MLAEGPERVAERIRATGATSAFVAAVYHSVEQVQTHLDCRTYTLQDTSFWFAADQHCFARSGLQPSAPPVPGCIDPLGEIARACHHAGLKLRAWIVCCHAATFGKAHPELCQRNCLGEVLSATLCPSQPEVQNYVETLIRFLVQRYGLDGVILESLQFHPWRPVTPYQKTAVEFGPLERYFQGLCVCAECRKRAAAQGVDSERVVRAASAVLAEFQAGGTPLAGTIADTLAADDDLRAYHETRRQTLRSFVTRCHSAAQPGSSGLFLLWDEHTAGIRLGEVSEAVTDVFELFHSVDPEAAASAARQRFSRESISRHHYWASLCGSRANFADAMTGLARAGVVNFAVYNYGVMTFQQLESARAAFENARSAIWETQ
jgi:hypothetical protein